MQPVIHLIFKTHLDIGFTDLAGRVRAQYHRQFIPQAIATGAHFHRENPGRPMFVWTTGAWLIHDHLATGTPDQVAALEQAIHRGLIAWHALPYTTHTELMSAPLFRAGLSYAAELDARFGRQTIAAKMTDVPGHTIGMVPHLAAAGVRFLHLGVNTASPVPDVPPLFRWRAPDGSEVVVMYQGDYGQTDFPFPDLGLSFAHTSDNIGPQSVGQTAEAWRHLAIAHPEAEIRASTLDAFGAEVWARRDSLPVVTDEIGDSWIHGTASDPAKLARFRALQRLYDGFQTLTPARLDFGRGLAMVAEHTWGVDIKTWLRDENAWDRAAFDAARISDPRFAYSESSWAEQRAYLDAAVAALGPEDRAAATAVQDLAPGPALALRPADSIETGGWRIGLDPETGDVASITSPSGAMLTGADGSLFGYRHESHDAASMRQHMDSYLQHRLLWAVLDHDKPGLDRAATARRADFAPRHLGSGIAAMPEDAHALLGAPAQVQFAFAAQGDALEIALTLRGKPANRMPEAGFMTVTPAAADGWALRKMGLWHAPAAYARRGGAQLQAVEALRGTSARQGFALDLLDAALVAPNGTPFMEYCAEPPDYAGGMRVNLYNNKWGTNFPMWWEGDIRFRFVLRLD